MEANMGDEEDKIGNVYSLQNSDIPRELCGITQVGVALMCTVFANDDLMSLSH